MKKCILFALLLLYFPINAQTMNDNLTKRLGELEDRMALKELVDTFSILADKKDVQAQTLLFTANGTVETYVGGNRVANLAGRKAMGDAFGAFLARFETVYHMNGQQTVTLSGDRASGVLYCTVTLIGTEGGKTMKTTLGVSYTDEYVREGNRWLIAQRKSVFNWQDKRELGQ